MFLVLSASTIQIAHLVVQTESENFCYKPVGVSEVPFFTETFV